ncbi:hypothetical protein CU098_004630 [Rhizopus stolonifer]|uniref:Uncharacterized protein n=1 Tax=Rhizopus stolonifer TaxID=4846 RepID=A0A367K6E3_RHIST|nr:hypothetical protein CU098_004630 [Rhizopus stolonifer]
MSTIASQAFDMHLKNLILDHYPTDQKSILDLLLSDWTMRDRFHRHLDVVMDTLLSQLDQKKYNIRTCPYYAFVQLFSLSEPQNNSINNTTYQIKSGAFIDLSQFSNCTDSVLMQGCCKVLQKMTLYPNPNHQVTDWAADCLKSASADIIQFYTGWLTQGLERELATQSSNTFHQYAKFTLLLLNTCVNQSTHVVPTLLQTLSDTGLQWLLQTHRKSASILLHYFDDESQVSKDMVVTQLLGTKTKSFIDLLLNYLRDMMSGTDPKLPRSRRWFKNHFLKNVLLLVCEQADTSVSACLFRQWFKTRDDFEWYFSTPLPQQITLDGLDLTRSHRIYGIKHTGLAAMFQDMVGDHVKKERLIQIWFDLWVSDHTFTVPVSWILQCTGLYDQAPVLMKQMIKKLIYVGIQHTGFLDAMMDLVLLSDAPEPDSLFELILEVACETQGTETTYKRINANIIHLMIELSEELDLATTVQPSNTAEKKLSKKQRRKLKKHGKLPHNKLRSMMRKHEEELEKYLRESNTSTHNNGCLKALTTLVQRLFNFLLRLLLSVSTVDSTNNSLSIKQDVQRQLMSTPLFYEPLAKFIKLIRQPEDLQEDIQATIDISTDYLKRLSDPSLFKASQNIMHEQIN